MKNKGFTLIELIIAIVILGILVGIAVPSIIGYVEKSQETVCLANRSTIERDYTIYAINNLEKTITVSEYKEYVGKNIIEISNICPSKYAVLI